MNKDKKIGQDKTGARNKADISFIVEEKDGRYQYFAKVASADITVQVKNAALASGDKFWFLVETDGEDILLLEETVQHIYETVKKISSVLEEDSCVG